MTGVALGVALVVSLLLGVTPAWAESWVLWSANTWWDQQHTAGVYPTAAACLAAARPEATAHVKRLVAFRREDDRVSGNKTSITQSPPRESSNPPGVLIALVVRTSYKNSDGEWVSTQGIRVVVVTQCWPAGVTPR